MAKLLSGFGPVIKPADPRNASRQTSPPLTPAAHRRREVRIVAILPDTGESNLSTLLCCFGNKEVSI
jgi:hypothetical protein